MKKLLVVALAFSTLYISSCKSGDGGDPKAVLTSFFDAMAKKDFATARKLSTTESKSVLDMLEEGMKMQDNMMDDKPTEQFDRSKIEIGEAKIDGDKATISVKEKKSGSGGDFVLRKQGGEWKVAMDAATMMNMGSEKMKEKGMSDEQMGDMKEEMEKFKNMNADSLKEMMKKGMEALDTLKKALDKK